MDVITQVTRHVISVLMAALPADLLATLKLGNRMPGLVGDLPFISVAAEVAGARLTGSGQTIDIAHTQVNGSLIDIGFRNGLAGDCYFHLQVWAVTQTQLEKIRDALLEVDWLAHRNSWENPPGTLNRTAMLRCQLANTGLAELSPLSLTPPMIVINVNKANLHSGASTSSSVLGEAHNNDRFELLGRSADNSFLQGRCLEGHIIWVSVSNAIAPVPISRAPLAENLPVTTGATYSPFPVLGNIAFWRQALKYQGVMELTQEPLTDSGEQIEEVRVSHTIDAGEQAPAIEREIIFSDHVVKVTNFP